MFDFLPQYAVHNSIQQFQFHYGFFVWIQILRVHIYGRHKTQWCFLHFCTLLMKLWCLFPMMFTLIIVKNILFCVGIIMTPLYSPWHAITTLGMLKQRKSETAKNNQKRWKMLESGEKKRKQIVRATNQKQKGKNWTGRQFEPRFF